MPKLSIIKDILEQRNISVSDFCKEIKMSVTGFRRILERNSTRIQTLEVIASALNCPVGAFFGDAPYSEEKKSDKLAPMRPHIPFSAQAGRMAGMSEGITAETCDMMPEINTFGHYDFTIDVKGDSMLDVYHSGDIVACRLLEPGESIHYGEVYVLDTAQGVVMKQVEKILNEKEMLLCVSFNKEYKPFTVEKKDIYAMSRVVGLIKTI